jgi:ribosome maturation factor RimP
LKQKERVEAFLKELDELSDKYNLEITAEGTSPLLYDTKKKDWVGEFGRSFFGGDYKIYE